MQCACRLKANTNGRKCPGANGLVERLCETAPASSGRPRRELVGQDAAVGRGIEQAAHEPEALVRAPEGQQLLDP